jgi:predicted nucleotidyltransferase
LLEWLGSPIIYQEKYSIAQKMRDLRPSFYNPIACMYHYLHMAQGNNREYLKGDEVWVKKYFYVLRPVLAVNWIERELGVVPTEFEVLVNKIIGSSNLRQKISNLVEAKRAGQELDYGPRIPEISDFVDAEISRLEDKKLETKFDKLLIDGLNELFRAALAEVWAS